MPASFVFSSNFHDLLEGKRKSIYFFFDKVSYATSVCKGTGI